jgi:hypothetical protein
MASEQNSNGIRRSTLYGWMALVFGSMFFAFLASSPLRYDGAWMFVAFWLIGMQLLSVGMLLVAAYAEWKLVADRLSEKQAAEKPPAEPNAAADRPRDAVPSNTTPPPA